MTRTSLPLPQPFDRQWMLAFLRGRQAQGLETIDETTVVRAVRLAGRGAVVRITIDDARGRVRADTAAAVPAAALRALVTRMLDLNTELSPFHALAARDRRLGPLVRRAPGLRIPQFADPFEAIVRAILGQQVSVRGASTLVGRFVGAFGETIDGEPLRAFPAPSRLAAERPDVLQQLGLTRAKAAAIHGVARVVAAGTFDLEALRGASAEDAQRALDALPGIGPWTASYVRMRAYGDPDAFPAADLGILKALRVLTRRQSLAVGEIERYAAAWRPWRAYAALHLWNSLA